MTLCDLNAWAKRSSLGDHDPLRFERVGQEVIAAGEVDSRSLDGLEDILNAYPEVATLVLKHVGGSIDDAANLELARFVRDFGLNTRIPADGLVASGGTDLFLAGVHRVIEAGACVGVHSWAADTFTARDLPRADPEHRPYLAYYAAIGIPDDFYWFTLEAAPADSMHWMTAEEAEQYGAVGSATGTLGARDVCDQR